MSEPSVADLTPSYASRKRSDESMKIWKAVGLIAGVLAGAGTVAGVVGKAFYVTREEYTAKVTQDAVVSSSMQQTLNQLNDTMREQRHSFDRFTGELTNVKTDLAVIKAATNERRSR